MARGFLAGALSGVFVSVIGAGTASLVAGPPAGVPTAQATTEAATDAPMVGDAAADATQTDTTQTDATRTDAEAADTNATEGGSPVGTTSIDAPQTPDLPQTPTADGAETSPAAPTASDQTEAPRADTDPLDEPTVTSIEGAMDAPAVPETSDVAAALENPVLPNPQSQPPQTPDAESDLTVSTNPAAPLVEVIEDEARAPDTDATQDTESEGAPSEGTEAEEFFVVDLGEDAPEVEAANDPVDTATDATADITDAPTPQSEDAILADAGATQEPAPRLQLQGAENTLLGNRETGVTINRPTDDASAASADPSEAAATTDDLPALVAYAADAGDTGGLPLMSIILLDDGSMSAASAALAGVPFPVTIAIDPAMENAAAMAAAYRANGFEVLVLASLPEGARPSDVEITFESVFSDLPETVGLLDLGNAGLQNDRAVTEQAMDILAGEGRGFITASQGLNMAGRAAEAAGVPAAIVFRDLDSEGQDARVIRRFVDQAAFRARQESGVVLVGRVRPDTISALILWGTANRAGQVALVPVSAVLTAQ